LCDCVSRNAGGTMTWCLKTRHAASPRPRSASSMTPSGMIFTSASCRNISDKHISAIWEIINSLDSFLLNMHHVKNKYWKVPEGVNQTEGDWEHPSSTASHQQSHQPQTASAQRPQQSSAWHPPRWDQVLWGQQTSEPVERRKGTAQRPMQHSPRSLYYSPHHPFGCGRHHLQHPHSEAFQRTGSRFSKS